MFAFSSVIDVRCWEFLHDLALLFFLSILHSIIDLVSVESQLFTRVPEVPTSPYVPVDTLALTNNLLDRPSKAPRRCLLRCLPRCLAMYLAICLAIVLDDKPHRFTDGFSFSSARKTAMTAL